MRIPFFNRRERIPTLYQKGIENEFALNARAQYYLVALFMGEGKPCQYLPFIFEQLYIVYNLAMFAGSHEVSDEARKALRMLRSEFEEIQCSGLYVMNHGTATVCSKALQEGQKVLQELPRSEFKLAYVQAKLITDKPENILKYLGLLS